MSSSILLHHIFRLHIALSARSTLAFLLISISAYIRTFRLVNAYTAQPVVSEIINNLCGHQGAVDGSQNRIIFTTALNSGRIMGYEIEEAGE